MGRGRASWRSPLADKYFHYTCRISLKPSVLQESWAHLHTAHHTGQEALNSQQQQNKNKLILRGDRVFRERQCTCASWTTLLRIRYWVFTCQSRTLDCATFHMACLREEHWRIYKHAIFKSLTPRQQVEKLKQRLHNRSVQRRFPLDLFVLQMREW